MNGGGAGSRTRVLDTLSNSVYVIVYVCADTTHLITGMERHSTAPKSDIVSRASGPEGPSTCTLATRPVGSLPDTYVLFADVTKLCASRAASSAGHCLVN